MILNDALAVFALESAAEHLTTARPMGNRLPDRGMHVTGAVASKSRPGTLSVPVQVSSTRTRSQEVGSRRREQGLGEPKSSSAARARS